MIRAARIATGRGSHPVPTPGPTCRQMDGLWENYEDLFYAIERQYLDCIEPLPPAKHFLFAKGIIIERLDAGKSLDHLFW